MNREIQVADALRFGRLAETLRRLQDLKYRFEVEHEILPRADSAFLFFWQLRFSYPARVWINRQLAKSPYGDRSD